MQQSCGDLRSTRSTYFACWHQLWYTLFVFEHSTRRCSSLSGELKFVFHGLSSGDGNPYFLEVRGPVFGIVSLELPLLLFQGLLHKLQDWTPGRNVYRQSSGLAFFQLKTQFQKVSCIDSHGTRQPRTNMVSQDQRS